MNFNKKFRIENLQKIKSLYTYIYFLIKFKTIKETCQTLHLLNLE